MHSEPVLLINMPFGPLNLPSLGLSLLKGGLSQKGISSKIHYFNITFANLIGEETYRLIARGFPRNVDQIGEWIFSNSLFPDQRNKDAEFIEEIVYGNNKYHSKESYLSRKELDQFVEKIVSAKEKVDAFLSDVLEIVMKQDPKIIGFTSIFQQHVASLALAKMIKARNKDILIVFGGANCEGPMGEETIKQFEFIDVLVSGEGDEVFPRLVEKYLESKEIIEAPGVYTRDCNFEVQNTALIHNMNEVAIPDFFDFFGHYSKFDFDHKPKLLLETSRGCWWGQKKHCTFCGLNGGSMTFRSKDENRVLSEFRLMKEHFPEASIAIVDNILDMTYFKSVLPTFIKEELDLDLFFEVKANLKKSQVRLLKQAGIHTIQPGIESFSDNVLNIMKKGVRAIQNIQFLKWCKEIGVNPQWNLIWGFQGEAEKDYKDTMELIPLISHLKPPVGYSNLRLDRFSPNYNESETLGFKDAKPYPAYRFIYPFSHESISNLAYFFSFEMDKPFDYKKIEGEIIDSIKEWKSSHNESELFMVDKEDVLLIWDFRSIANENYYLFEEKERAIYLMCDIMKTPKQISKVLIEDYNINLALNEIDEILSIFLNLKLMVRSENNFLSLAIPTYDFIPNAKILEKLENYIPL